MDLDTNSRQCGRYGESIFSQIRITNSRQCGCYGENIFCQIRILIVANAVVMTCYLAPVKTLHPHECFVVGFVGREFHATSLAMKKLIPIEIIRRYSLQKSQLNHLHQ